MNPLSAFFRALLLLTGIAFSERVIFASYHAELSASLSLWQLAVTLLQGWRFDLAVAATLTVAAYLPGYVASRVGFNFITTFRRVVYLAGATLVLIHGADLLYFAESGRHLGYELKEAFNSRGELLASALGAHTLPVLLQLAMVGAVIYAIRWSLPDEAPYRRTFGPEAGWSRHVAPEGRLIVVILAGALMLRGGLQPVPMEPLNAQSLGDPQRATLALNGSYNALFSSLTPYAVERVLREKPTNEQKALVKALYTHTPIVQPSAAPSSRPNVVVVFLESWSATYIGSYGNNTSPTPFLDDLRARSFTTREMLAGGHRTTEGLFAALCSAQNPLGGTVAQTQLQNYRYECLPHLLRRQGYHTAFFQGTIAGTSGTGAFVQLLGFEASYGKEDVAEHRLPYNSWGLQDGDIYDFAFAKMATLQEPFLIGINTNSTHDATLPPGTPEPFDSSTGEGRYQNALHYADGALHLFFDELTTRFPNTIFVAVSDHAGLTKGEPVINRYRIPFLLHVPQQVEGKRIETIASQRDVAPTIMQVVGLAPAPWFTGRSLLEPTRAPFADYYHQGLLGWIEGDQGIEFAVRQPDAVRCFSAQGDFASTPCTAEAASAAQRGLAHVTVLQDLLFSGQLAEFQHYREP